MNKQKSILSDMSEEELVDSTPKVYGSEGNYQVGITEGNVSSDVVQPEDPSGLTQSASGGSGEIGDSGENDSIELPTFSDRVFEMLPGILQEVTEAGESPQETDAVLLGSITVLSSVLPGVQGQYDRVTVYPNLYFYLSARAASGKGRVELCRLLISPIHHRLMEQTETEQEITTDEAAPASSDEEQEDDQGSNSGKSPHAMLIIPANSSATAVYQKLNENGGMGMVFETEGDTLANAFETDYGDYSDGFRKAFHHEPISYLRRTKNEYVYIECPRLSAVLTATPGQIASLFKSAENGLFSRFIHYRLQTQLKWRDVLGDSNSESLEDKFRSLGESYLQFYDALVKFGGPINFTMTQEQRYEFNKFFSGLQKEYYDIFKDEIIASVRRMGLIFFRICMILSALRLMDTGELTKDLVCADEDFETAKTICGVLVVHTARVFDELTKMGLSRSAYVAKTVKRRSFFEALPKEFTRQDYLEVAQRTGVPPSTAEKWIKRLSEENGPLEKVEHGQFRKKGL